MLGFYKNEIRFFFKYFPWTLLGVKGLDVSGKLPSYPSPKPTLTLTSHLGQNVGLREG